MIEFEPRLGASPRSLVDQLQTRLALLQQEFAKEQVGLRELERQEAGLRESLLRISGAMQVLHELLGELAVPEGRADETPPAQASAARPADPARLER